MRIRDLAKDIKKTNKELVDICHKLKIPVSNHMSSIDGDATRLIMEYLEKQKKKEADSEKEKQTKFKKKEAPESLPVQEPPKVEAKESHIEEETKEEEAIEEQPEFHPQGVVKARDVSIHDTKGTHATKEVEEKKKRALLKLQLVKLKMSGAPLPADLSPELKELLEEEQKTKKPEQPMPVEEKKLTPPIKTAPMPPIVKKPSDLQAPERKPPAKPIETTTQKVEPHPQKEHPDTKTFIKAPHKIKPTITTLPAKQLFDKKSETPPVHHDRRPPFAKPFESDKFKKPHPFTPVKDQFPKDKIAFDEDIEGVDADRKRRRKKKKKDTFLTIPPTIEVMSFKDVKHGRDRKKTKFIPKDKEFKKPKLTKYDAEDLLDGQDTSQKSQKSKKIRPSFILTPQKTVTPKEKDESGTKTTFQPKPAAPPKPKKVQIKGDISVGQFAEKVNQPSSEIIKKILLMGQAVNINQILDHEVCELLALELGYEIEIIPESDEHDLEEFQIPSDPSKMKPRPPVITIMGHVDHGKTTLLDTLRKSDLVSGEYGGITQHIGAYYVKTEKGDFVFLDTPGHEAFTAMRARGAKVTDFVILIVSAVDGVMPQTVEAINHAKAANVPIIVAVNKIDLPGANTEKIKNELMKYELVPEELGGQTIIAEISAKKGIGIEHLLEMISLQSEIMELKADPDRPAEGMIIESHIDSNRGVVATVLVNKGTLHVGDAFLSGVQAGKVRLMMDEHGLQLSDAGPSKPVSVLGFTDCPIVGEYFTVLPDEKIAREIAAKRSERRRSKSFFEQQRSVTLENLHEFIEDGAKEFFIILKGDVLGTVEAIMQSVEKLSTEKIRMRILHAGVGAINDSDVNLAIASNAIIIGFNVRPETSASEIAERNKIEIKTYRIIYDLLDDIKKAMKGMLEPKYKEVLQGHAEVRQVFRISKLGNIAGCYVIDGEIVRNAKARLIRDNVVIYDGEISSVRRTKDDVTKVSTGFECGIGLNKYDDIKEKDIIETFTLEEIPQEI